MSDDPSSRLEAAVREVIRVFMRSAVREVSSIRAVRRLVAMRGRLRELCGQEACTQDRNQIAAFNPHGRGARSYH
jgi:hypothetical protein